MSPEAIRAACHEIIDGGCRRRCRKAEKARVDELFRRDAKRRDRGPGNQGPGTWRWALCQWQRDAWAREAER